MARRAIALEDAAGEFARAQGLHTSLKAVLSRAGKALLLVLAVLIVLPLVGIDLTVLSVFGGALGVIELEVGFWIHDPEQGTGNVRCDVSVAMLAEFRARGVEIPVPQREVTLQRANANKGAAEAA